jgi:hypothetical protein
MIGLRSKYKVKERWINSEPLKNSSITWKAIERLKPLIRKGACFIIGDGKKVDCWKDPWLPSFIPGPKDASVVINPFMVENLINGETNTWRFDLIMDMFYQESVMAITKIILPVIPRTDKLTWVANPKGLFSMKSVMVLIQRDVWPAAPDPIWHKFWKSKIHERLKTFVWCIGCGTLPTNLNIFFRMSKGDPRCPLCNSEVESVSHVFFKCQATKMFWFGTC